MFKPELDPDSVFISLTSHCNLKCKGCDYGKDFMPGEIFPEHLLEPLIEDATKAGYTKMRLYGGEPLIYPHLVKAVELCVKYDMKPWLTTNGFLLKQKVDKLYDAGLRQISIGYYGTDEAYDEYVGRKDSFAKLREGVAYIREKYGKKIKLKLEFLLMKPTCNDKALDDAFAFAKEFSIPITVNLIHYSLPYFKDADDESLQFTEADRGIIERFVSRLLQKKQAYPKIFNRSESGLASIPDWLIRREDMKVSCDRHDMLWIGPDGSVLLCYVTFNLGNLNTMRLRDLVHTPKHHTAVDDCINLRCPNCHCGYSTRIDRDPVARKKYSTLHHVKYIESVEL